MYKITKIDYMQAFLGLRQKIEEILKTMPFFPPAIADFLKTARKEDVALFIGANTYGFMIIAALLTLEGYHFEGIVACLFFIFMIFILNIYCIYDKALLMRYFDENPGLFAQSYEAENQIVAVEGSKAREEGAKNLFLPKNPNKIYSSTNLALRGAVCRKPVDPSFSDSAINFEERERR